MIPVNFFVTRGGDGRDDDSDRCAFLLRVGTIPSLRDGPKVLAEGNGCDSHLLARSEDRGRDRRRDRDRDRVRISFFELF